MGYLDRGMNPLCPPFPEYVAIVDVENKNFGYLENGGIQSLFISSIHLRLIFFIN